MIKILDCTLRDGGYINNWEFGYENIKKILSSLAKTDINLIECGFLSDNKTNSNQSLYKTIEEINNYIDNNNLKKYCVMLAFGKYKIEKLPKYNDKLIKNIRFIFKQNELSNALKYAKIIKEKGYNLFFNPTFISTYKLKNLHSLIKDINKINPYCASIVDSMGVLDNKKFKEILNIFNDNLNNEIKLGIHLHNNLNYADDNLEIVQNLDFKREIIIDATICGLGRGGGNVVLENLIQDEIIKTLKIENLNKIIEKFNNIDKNNYKLSALNHCHPCYATYLSRNNINSNDKINAIFQSIPDDFKTNYNLDVIKKTTQDFLINS